MRTSPSYTASYRIEVDEKTTSIASIVDVVSSTGAEIKGGKVQAAGALVGEVMKATRGQADAARVRELIMEMVGA